MEWDESAYRVHEELGAAAVRLAGVRHGEGSGFVRDPLSEFVGDVTAPIASDGLPGGRRVGSPSVWTASSSAIRPRVLWETV